MVLVLLRPQVCGFACSSEVRRDFALNSLELKVTYPCDRKHTGLLVATRGYRMEVVNLPPYLEWDTAIQYQLLRRSSKVVGI